MLYAINGERVSHKVNFARISFTYVHSINMYIENL